MLPIYLKTADIISKYPLLSDYMRKDESSYDNVIKMARNDLQSVLKSKNFSIAKLCTPLTLNADTFVNDTIERDRFVIKVTAFTSECIVSLYGNVEDSATNEVLLFNDLIISGIGEYTVIVDNPKPYYKLVLSNAVGITYTSYMVETTFDMLLEMLVISRCFGRIKQYQDDMYANEELRYYDDYQKLLESVKPSYDDDLDGVIDDSEEQLRQTFEMIKG